MEITIAYLDEDNIQKSKGKKDVLGATHIWGTKKFKKGPDGWHHVKDADNKERGDDRPNTVCDLDDGDGWRPGPKNLVGKFYQKDGKKWKVVSADLKAGTARCTTGLGKSYESKTADLKELAGEDFEKSVFDEFEPTSDDIEKGVKANIGEIRIWGGKRVRKQSNGKWVEVSEQSLSKKEHENMNFYHDKESNRWRNVEGKNDLRVSHDERKFEHKELASKLSDKEYDESELDIEKSFHEYFKREGTPGNYKYYYTEDQYKQAKSGVDKFEIGDIVRIQDGFVSKKTDHDKSFLGFTKTDAVDSLTKNGFTTHTEELKANVQDLKSKLNGISGYNGNIINYSQADNDPDLGLIVNKGKEFSINNLEVLLGKGGECHWNVAKLYDEGKIDKIVIGYARNPNNMGWHQHTWGLKGGKIVETTSENIKDKGYFGYVLNDKESEYFVKDTKDFKPGQGKIRSGQSNINK